MRQSTWQAGRRSARRPRFGLLAGPAAEKIVPGITSAGLVILWIAALLTLWTGYDYLKAGVVHAMER